MAPRSNRPRLSAEGGGEPKSMEHGLAGRRDENVGRHKVAGDEPLAVKGMRGSHSRRKSASTAGGASTRHGPRGSPAGPVPPDGAAPLAEARIGGSSSASRA